MVINLQAINDAFLELRIRLQKPLGLANRLPVHGGLEEACASNPSVRDAQTGLCHALSGLFSDLLRIRAALCAANPDVVRTVTAGKRGREASDVEGMLLMDQLPPLAKRGRLDGEEEEEEEGVVLDSDRLWEIADHGWQLTETYRNTTIDTWGRKLRLASGITARQAQKLKVMGADISKQVQEVMADDDRLISRSRPPAAGLAVVAQPSASTDPRFAVNGYYVEGFDDSEFYQQLLREYVASTAAEAGGVAGSHDFAALITKHKSKKREGVDRRATKGRKLKYVAHPKLVSFMAPVPYVVPPELSYDLDTIVASLFKSS